MKKSSWTFLFIGFWREETGDHVDVECPTEENSDTPKLGKMWPGNDEGFERRWSVYQDSLEKRDDHTFILRWDEERPTVSVDGKEVWSVPTQMAMDVLEANGFTVTATNEDVVEAGLSVAAGTMKYEGLLDWVRRHLV